MLVTAWTEQMRRELADVSVLTLDELRELPECGDFDGGVYFLWLKDALQYVGKSNQICNRLTAHEHARMFGHFRTYRTNQIPFDRHTCIAIDSGWKIDQSQQYRKKMQRLERAYIAHYEPPFNYLHANVGT